MAPTRRRLAVFQEANSFSPFEIAEAAGDYCDLVWVVGWSPNAQIGSSRLLPRLGEVVDVDGQVEEQAVKTLAALDLDGVVVFTDPPQVLAAALAEHLGLPFHSPGTAKALSDKYEQRLVLEGAGIPVPPYVALRPVAFRSGGRPLREDFPFPAVLKPRRGSGSRDTFRVGDMAELLSTLASCRDEDFVLEAELAGRYDGAGSGTGMVSGTDMVSVETVVRDGHAEHVAVTGRFPLAPPFRETGSFLPSDLSPDDTAAVLATADAAVVALGVRHGILHTEIKLTPDGPRIIEVNGRLGGGIDRLLSRVGGPPLMRWAMRLALSLEVGPVARLAGSPVAFFSWVLAPGGATRVERAGGVNDLRTLPGVDTVRLNRRAGDTVDVREGGGGHVVAVEGTVATHADLALLRHRIDATLSLTFS